MPLFNAVFAGRAVHPVELYLGTLRRLAIGGTVVLLSCVSIIFLALRYGERRRALIAGVVGGADV